MSITQEILAKLQEKDAGQPNFYRRAGGSDNPRTDHSKTSGFCEIQVYDRIVVPDRAVLFRVPWVDDLGDVQ